MSTPIPTTDLWFKLTKQRPAPPSRQLETFASFILTDCPKIPVIVGPNYAVGLMKTLASDTGVLLAWGHRRGNREVADRVQGNIVT